MLRGHGLDRCMKNSRSNLHTFLQATREELPLRLPRLEGLHVCNRVSKSTIFDQAGTVVRRGKALMQQSENFFRRVESTICVPARRRRWSSMIVAAKQL